MHSIPHRAAMIMKYWTFVLCIALLSSSCNSILSSRPSGTMNEKQMIDILVDIHLAEATIRLANDSITRLNDTTDLRIRFSRVFKQHDVTPDEFNTSLNYYLAHIEELDKIYVEVINRLTILEATLQQNKVVSPLIRGNSLKPGLNKAAFSSKWFPASSKNGKPAVILYFDASKYPALYEEEIIPPAAR